MGCVGAMLPTGPPLGAQLPGLLTVSVASLLPSPAPGGTSTHAESIALVIVYEASSVLHPPSVKTETSAEHSPP